MEPCRAEHEPGIASTKCARELADAGVGAARGRRKVHVHARLDIACDGSRERGQLGGQGGHVESVVVERTGAVHAGTDRE